MLYELVSFSICPYVQRSVILLKQKKVDFKLTFIDLESPPSWFTKISPLGKVPVLLIRNAPGAEPAVLFESAIINEYIDEITPPSLMPTDPLKKAQERDWIQVGSELLMSLSSVFSSSINTEEVSEFWETLSRVEEVLPSSIASGKFFHGKDLSLVDVAYAPLFMRLLFFKKLQDDTHWASLPKTRIWAETLIALPVVRDSVVPDFSERFVAFLRKRKSPLVTAAA